MYNSTMLLCSKLYDILCCCALLTIIFYMRRAIEFCSFHVCMMCFVWMHECVTNVDLMNTDLVIGDFGCGEGRLSLSVKNTVHSFDLVAVGTHVVACDSSHVPLDDGVLDVAIFCLSLMGSNWER